MKKNTTPLTPEEQKTKPVREAIHIADNLEKKEQQGNISASEKLQLETIRENLHI